MTNKLDTQILELADYLGCNGPELLSELKPLISTEVAKAFEAGHEDCKLAGNPTTHKFFKEATAKEVAKARADERRKANREIVQQINAEVESDG